MTKPKKKAAPVNPLHFAAQQLRKTSAYSSGRAIIKGTALLNGVIQPLALTLTTLDSMSPILIFVFCLSIILFWILFHQIGQAYFDIADSHLDRGRRNIIEDQKTRNTDLH